MNKKLKPRGKRRVDAFAKEEVAELQKSEAAREKHARALAYAPRAILK